MYCSNCGKSISENSNFCQACGQKVEFLNSDPILDGMHELNVINETENSTNSNSEFWEGLLTLIGIVLGNLIMLVATFFSTYGIIKASEVLMDSVWLSFFYLLIFIVPTIIWQFMNDKIFEWKEDFQSNKLEDVSFWTYFSIFIPIAPAIFRLYYSTQNENFSISMGNILFYIFLIVSCFIYYWITKSDD